MDGRFRGLTAIVAVLALIVGGAYSHSTINAAALPKPTHTNKSRFRIPFRFDANALQRMNAREIQLHVSRDHGETWEMTQTLSPDGGKFEFQAVGEGEFWFSVKTLDGRNQLHPQRGSYETGLIVVVDQTPPQLELSARQIAAGQLQVNWKASDINLDANSLKIEYQVSGAGNWESIPVSGRSSGEFVWTVNQTGLIAVRGSVADLSGNVGHSTAQANATAAGVANEKPQPSRRGPIAMPGEDTGTIEHEALSAVTPPNTEIADPDNQMPIITPRGALPRYAPASQRLVSSTRSSASQERWPSASVDTGIPAVPTATIPPVQTPNSDWNSNQFAQTPPVMPPTTPPVATTNPTQVPPFAPSPPAHSQQTQHYGQPAAQRRAGSRERVVATRRFQINYKLDDIGPSGIGGVELFITEDNGRVWWKYGDDPDQKSPFDVEVPHDGIYGFAIRVRSGAGLSTEPPLPGEPPSIVIAVDQTPPVVELLPIQQGQGTNTNRLMIRWRMIEEHPADRPVSLYYAANLNGPWEPISGWREDTNGTFEWVVGPGVPPQFYVRVMAKDSAGNVGKAETPMPIVVDLQRPSARIVDVEVTPGIGPQ